MPSSGHPEQATLLEKLGDPLSLSIPPAIPGHSVLPQRKRRRHKRLKNGREMGHTSERDQWQTGS